MIDSFFRIATAPDHSSDSIMAPFAQGNQGINRFGSKHIGILDMMHLKLDDFIACLATMLVAIQSRLSDFSPYSRSYVFFVSHGDPFGTERYGTERYVTPRNDTRRYATARYSSIF